MNMCLAVIKPQEAATRWLTRVAALLLLCAWVQASRAQAPLEVTLAFAGPAQSPAHQGALQGLAEANAQGEFLGQHYQLVAWPSNEGAALASPPLAVVAALPADALLALARAQPTLIIINVAADADAARAPCLPNLLHTLPSAAMRAAAEAQWREAQPEGPPAQARAWHATFQKYAAAQLNKRYRDATGQAMTDEAWAGWAAVKVVSDLVARIQSTEPAAVATALRHDLAFDGQKGTDMDFRADGQLRQPLLLVHQDKVVGEAPVRGVAEVEDLDSLGTAQCAP